MTPVPPRCPPVLVYEQADVPAGMTLREYRRLTRPRRSTRRGRLGARLARRLGR